MTYTNNNNITPVPYSGHNNNDITYRYYTRTWCYIRVFIKRPSLIAPNDNAHKRKISQIVRRKIITIINNNIVMWAHTRVYDPSRTHPWPYSHVSLPFPRPVVTHRVHVPSYFYTGRHLIFVFNSITIILCAYRQFAYNNHNNNNTTSPRGYRLISSSQHHTRRRVPTASANAWAVFPRNPPKHDIPSPRVFLTTKLCDRFRPHRR